MTDPAVREKIVAVLKGAETSWNGFVDPEAVADAELEALKKDPPIHDDEPSSDFVDAFSAGVGTVSATCGLCGRTLFGSGLEHHGDDGEWEEALEGLRSDPARWVRVADDDMVSLVSVGGMQAVIGCPCNGLRKYENFIWGEREKIAAYYKARLGKARETMTALKDTVAVSELVAKT